MRIHAPVLFGLFVLLLATAAFAQIARPTLPTLPTVPTVPTVPTPQPPTIQTPTATPTFYVTVNPNTLPADGQSTAQITAMIFDSAGHPVTLQYVSFTSTLGMISSVPVMTDGNGMATTTITAPTQTGIGYIFARCGINGGNGSITFLPATNTQPKTVGPPAVIYLRTMPESTPADGATTVQVDAKVIDANGAPVPNATVSFATSSGRLLQRSATTGNDGIASIKLLAADKPGTAEIDAGTATPDGNTVSASCNLEFKQATDSDKTKETAKPKTDENSTTQQTEVTGALLGFQSSATQKSTFVAHNWVSHSFQASAGSQPGEPTRTLDILDAAGAPVQEIKLGEHAGLVLDQYGAAHGYTSETAAQLNVILLGADGSSKSNANVDLPADSHVVSAYFANPAGETVVSIAKQDGSAPLLFFLSPTGSKLLRLSEKRDGLKALPLVALDGDGHLALAFSDGLVRLYDPQGQQLFEAHRTDGLSATAIAVGPGGEWVAVAAGQAGNSNSNVTVYSNAGDTLATYNLAAARLAPAGKTALVAGTQDSTVYLNLRTQKARWTIPGGFERFLMVKNQAVLVGQSAGTKGETTSRIRVIRLLDGSPVSSCIADDGKHAIAILPPDEAGLVEVITASSLLRFPVQGE